MPQKGRCELFNISKIANNLDSTLSFYIEPSYDVRNLRFYLPSGLGNRSNPEHSLLGFQGFRAEFHKVSSR